MTHRDFAHYNKAYFDKWYLLPLGMHCYLPKRIAYRAAELEKAWRIMSR